MIEKHESINFMFGIFQLFSFYLLFNPLSDFGKHLSLFTQFFFTLGLNVLNPETLKMTIELSWVGRVSANQRTIWESLAGGTNDTIKQMFIQTCIYSVNCFRSLLTNALAWRPLQNVVSNTDTRFYTQNIKVAPEQYSIKYFTVNTIFLVSHKLEFSIGCWWMK